MKLATLIASILALAGPAGEGPPDPGDVYEGAAGELSVPAPTVIDARIDVDGLLDEAAWSWSAVLTSFTQLEPSEGAPASQRTEILLFTTADALFVGVRAYESDPSTIRATLSERDEFTRSDDYVRLVLDTFDDKRRAYVFSVNPLGVQHDGLWIEGRVTRMGGMGPPIDDNPDFLWESEARATPEGWVAEVRIPFKSLRFPEADLQAWGINVFRRFQKSGFEESWAPVTADEANRLAQSGRLTGLRDLDPGLFLEVNPVLTGKRVGSLDEATGRFRHDDAEADFGLNATYGITSNLTLDATYNPDFSQIEADAGQIAVNERFALFFPEKRPFFLEGTEIFSLPKNLIYTRSVISPVGGAKLTGKIGGLSLGYLGAVDDVPDQDRDAVVNIVRARRDLGASSSLGMLYTDRTRASNDYNRVAGADARLVFARRYTVTLLGAASFTGDPGRDIGTGSFFNARAERAGRSLSINAEIEDVAPDFRAESGFLQRVGDTQVESEVRYNRYGRPGAMVERWGPSLTLRGFWDHDAFWAGESFEEGRLEMGGSVSLRNNISVFLNWNRTTFDVPSDAYEGLQVVAPDGTASPFRPDQARFSGMDGLRLFFWVNTLERARGNARVEWRETPIFDRSLGVPVQTADGWSGELSLNLFLSRALKGEVGLRHETLRRKSDGSRYSSATIPRLRLQYQLSRALFVRSILEYASQERGALVDPLTGNPLGGCDQDGCSLRAASEDHDVHVEALISYEPSPGTVMYLGYSRDMVDEARFRFGDVSPRADGLFAKVSYRFRF